MRAGMLWRKRLTPSMQYRQKLADRMSVLIRSAQNPQEAMQEIAQAAEQGGLIDLESMPRQTDETIFSADLLIENPVAEDWMNLRLEQMPPPLKIADVPQLTDLLR